MAKGKIDTMPTNQDYLPELPLPDVTSGPWPTFAISEADRRAMSNGSLRLIKGGVTGKLVEHAFLIKTLQSPIEKYATDTHANTVGTAFYMQEVVMQSHMPIRSTQPSMSSSLRTSSRSPVVSSPTIVRSTEYGKSSTSKNRPFLRGVSSSPVVNSPTIVRNTRYNKSNTNKIGLSSQKKEKSSQWASALAILVCIVTAVLFGGSWAQGQIQAYNMSATSTALAQKAATATVIANNPYPSYFPGHGILSVYDPLYRQGTEWSAQSNRDFGGECQNQEDGYHVRQVKNGYFICSGGQDFGDFAIQVQMKIIQGDCGGIALRHNASMGSGYVFFLCQDQRYYLYKYTNFSYVGSSRLSTSTYNTATAAGLNQVNTLGVLAQSSTILLYINGQQIDSLQDSSYSHGLLALLSDDQQNPTEVIYTDAKVWKLTS